MIEPLVSLTILGAPRTKKNHSRIAWAGSRRTILPSPQFVAYEKAALWQLRREWGRRLPITRDVHVRAIFSRDRNQGDLNNFTQALADILETARVLHNDRLIKSWDGSRLMVSKEQPRVDVWIFPFVE